MGSGDLQAESFPYIRATIRMGTYLALMLLCCILFHPLKATIHNSQIECCRNINKKGDLVKDPLLSPMTTYH